MPILGIIASSKLAAPTNFIAVGHSGSPNISVYPWIPGFGTKYANAATLPADSGRGITWNAAKDTIAVSFDNSPYVAVYPWTNATGFGTKYSNPATLPTGGAGDVAFTSNGANIAVAHDTSPYVTAYPWSSGFGTKYTNPATLPTGNGFGVSFNLSAAIAVAHTFSPYVTAYPFSGSGFGTKYANPGTLPTDDQKSIAFNAAGTYLSVGGSGGYQQSRINMYAWSSGFSTRYSPSLIEATMQGTAFTPVGTTIGYAMSAPDYNAFFPLE